MDHEEYLRRIKSYIKTPTKEIEQQLADFCSICSYVSGQYDRDESFLALNRHLEDLERGKKAAHRLFYMALPPSVFTIVSQHLKRCCYPTRGIARVIVSRKPTADFGTPLGRVLAEPDRSRTRRLRSRLVKISLVPESCSGRSSRTGKRMSSSALTTTLARRW